MSAERGFGKNITVEEEIHIREDARERFIKNHLNNKEECISSSSESSVGDVQVKTKKEKVDKKVEKA